MNKKTSRLWEHIPTETREDLDRLAEAHLPKVSKTSFTAYIISLGLEKYIAMNFPQSATMTDIVTLDVKPDPFDPDLMNKPNESKHDTD